jgi:nifR3 family TIM-barrel protein
MAPLASLAPLSGVRLAPPPPDRTAMLTAARAQPSVPPLNDPLGSFLAVQFRLGSFVPAAPVVLAPMAGVTNAPFRALCRRFGPGLVYVNEMVMATALVHGNAKTDRMVTFAPDEQPRSLQLYGSDPVMIGRAVDRVCAAGLVDHLDLNFGCPAAKVTRRGGGAAVPARPLLLAAIVRAAASAAEPYGVAVTAKFRIGLHDRLRTHLRAGTICREEGVVAIALHARTVEQHYAGEAQWQAIGELKAHVDGIPVLGNGDIWEAADAVAMMRATGCDGVVVGRGCLGRPWLFGDLVDVLQGRPVQGPRPLGFALSVMTEHARALVDHFTDEGPAMRTFRKHASWYLTGYPVGSETRRRFAGVSTLAELDDLVAGLDADLHVVPGGERIRRGHTNGPIRVALPDGFLDDPDALVVPDDADVLALSGG